MVWKDDFQEPRYFFFPFFLVMDPARQSRIDKLAQDAGRGLLRGVELALARDPTLARVHNLCVPPISLCLHFLLALGNRPQRRLRTDPGGRQWARGDCSSVVAARGSRVAGRWWVLFFSFFFHSLLSLCYCYYIYFLTSCLFNFL